MEIEAQNATTFSAQRLGKTLQSYPNLVEMKFITGEGTDSEQHLRISGNTLSLLFQTEDPIIMLSQLNVEILEKVQ